MCQRDRPVFDPTESTSGGIGFILVAAGILLFLPVLTLAIGTMDVSSRCAAWLRKNAWRTRTRSKQRHNLPQGALGPA